MTEESALNMDQKPPTGLLVSWLATIATLGLLALCTAVQASQAQPGQAPNIVQMLFNDVEMRCAYQRGGIALDKVLKNGDPLVFRIYDCEGKPTKVYYDFWGDRVTKRRMEDAPSGYWPQCDYVPPTGWGCMEFLEKEAREHGLIPQ